MEPMGTTCLMCSGRAGDAELGRVEVWSDDLWRLTTSVGPGDPTPGFSYLEPRRHLPYITDLDGPEAATFGAVIARCTSALKAATECELVYVYVFGGGIPHLHLHLAPHRAGDALNEAILRGEFEEQPLPSGATAYISKDFPSLPEDELCATAERVRALLA
jgi:diadenosine tetraphosphate (Ap4A) HIT family hydrolase